MTLSQLNIGDRFNIQGFSWPLIVTRTETYRNRTMVTFREVNSSLGRYTLNGSREVIDNNP